MVHFRLKQEIDEVDDIVPVNNRNNPLDGPEYEKRMNEMLEAQDAFAEEQEKNSPP
jgi:hypothetical protein